MQVQNGNVIIGGGRARVSHALRLTWQFVRCASCGDYCSGREARLLALACTRTAGATAEALRRVRRGLAPRPQSAALESDSTESLVIRGACAEQVPD